VILRTPCGPRELQVRVGVDQPHPAPGGLKQVDDVGGVRDARRRSASITAFPINWPRSRRDGVGNPSRYDAPVPPSRPTVDLRHRAARVQEGPHTILRLDRRGLGPHVWKSRGNRQSLTSRPRLEPRRRPPFAGRYARSGISTRPAGRSPPYPWPTAGAVITGAELVVQAATFGTLGEAQAAAKRSWAY
jgi:hypothetical protein